MTTKRIAGYKVDTVSRLMSDSKYDESIKNVKNRITQKATEFLKKFINSKVLNLWQDKNIKVYLKGFGSYAIRDFKDNFLFYSEIDLPKRDEKFKEANLNIKNQPELFDLIKKDIEEYESLVKAKSVFRNKLQCVLGDLKTYNKIKNEFPEAYKVLIEKVDKEKINKDTCTSVEELRAELIKIKL
jgi:hypothetical protein